MLWGWWVPFQACWAGCECEAPEQRCQFGLEEIHKIINEDVDYNSWTHEYWVYYVTWGDGFAWAIWQGPEFFSSLSDINTSCPQILILTLCSWSHELGNLGGWKKFVGWDIEYNSY